MKATETGVEIISCSGNVLTGDHRPFVGDAITRFTILLA